MYFSFMYTLFYLLCYIHSVHLLLRSTKHIANFKFLQCAFVIALYKTFRQLKNAVKHCKFNLKSADFLDLFPVHFLLIFDL